MSGADTGGPPGPPPGKLARRRAILGRIDATAAGTWVACRVCGALAHRARLRSQAGICPDCGAYFRLTAPERIAALTDPGSFTEEFGALTPEDPLSFTDRLPYPERIGHARAGTGLLEAVVSGTATIGGLPAVLAVMDFAFLGGSMGSVVGEKVARAAELALARRIPLVTVASSGGARMQEGVLSLFQMAKTAAAVRRLSQAGVPFISVLTDPVYGGVAASFASLGDIVIAEAGTRAGFAGPQVIKQTIGEKLDPGFQTADFLREHGHVDAVLGREELTDALRSILAFFAAAGRLPGPPHGGEPAPAGDLLPPADEADAWQAVRTARLADRPRVQDYIARIFTGFTELRGDRWSADDAAITGGLAWLGGAPVMVLGTCKGTGTADSIRRNFGMPHPAGYRKVMRLLALAGRMGIPVVTLVDTPGAYPGIRAEEENQSAAIAETLALAAGLPVPVVAVITGEGGSGGALAVCVSDRLLAQRNAILSVISPEGCATILFGDAKRAPQAARALRLTAPELLRLGVVDELVGEPDGGAHTDPDLAARLVGAAVARHLRDLLAVAPGELATQRYRRLRGYGQVGPGVPDRLPVRAEAAHA